MFVTDPQKNLSYAEKEVEAICKIYGLDHRKYEHNLKHRQATPRNVKERLKQDFDIVHFACHGSYDQNEPFSCYLELSGGKSLPLRTIMQIKLFNTELAVISACKTGLVDVGDVFR